MKRLVIDRLELDLRGLSPASAEEAARLLGPALARALAQGSLTARPATRLDAGRIVISNRHGRTLAEFAGGRSHLAGQTVAGETFFLER